MLATLKRFCHAVTPPVVWHGLRCLRSGASLRSLASPQREALIQGARDGLELRDKSTDALVLEQVLQEMPALVLDAQMTVIIDGGANGGFSSVWFARRFPEARIYAIEPDAENFALLCRNSRACPGVTPIQAALSNTVGEARLCDMGGGQWGYALESAVESAPASSAGNVSPAVKTINIPWLLDTFHISEIDLLKLDIEGA